MLYALLSLTLLAPPSTIVPNGFASPQVARTADAPGWIAAARVAFVGAELADTTSTAIGFRYGLREQNPVLRWAVGLTAAHSWAAIHNVRQAR